MPVAVKVLGTEDLKRVGALLALESDGLKLKRDLGASFRAAAEPIVAEQKIRVRSIRSVTPHSEPIREAVASNIKVRTRFTGVSTGIVIRAMTTEPVRGFTQAPRRLNARRGWRHPVFATGPRGTWRWVAQKGDPGWFSEPPFAHLDNFGAAAMAAIYAMEIRIASRSG